MGGMYHPLRMRLAGSALRMTDQHRDAIFVSTTQVWGSELKDSVRGDD